MERLSKDWITEKHIDFEYKKYVLLAYLKHVDDNFKHMRLYPALSDLIEHYKNAHALRENKNSISAHFPQHLKGIDTEHFRLEYEKAINDDRLMREIETILDFSLPRFMDWVNEGKQIYDFLEQEIHLGHVGLLPLDSRMGYLFLKDATASTQVYCFTVTLFEQPEAVFRGVHTQFLRAYPRNISHTFEAIKSELIQENKELPNPAVFAAETGLKIPIEETFLPIAKRMLMREVSA
jgi:hypothetical protein